MKTLTLKVPEDLFAKIACAAQARNVSKSEIARERLQRKSARTQTLAGASLWQRVEDLVINADSLPADLSSNKSHLKGYGRAHPHR